VFGWSDLRQIFKDHDLVGWFVSHQDATEEAAGTKKCKLYLELGICPIASRIQVLNKNNNDSAKRIKLK
jgi:hypothetical protein